MILTERKGFKTLARPVILDHEGQEFYTPTKKVNGHYYFNLPPGEYLFTEPLIITKPRPYETKIALPKKQRNLKGPYSITFDNMPHIGEIDHARKVITLDNSLRHQPRHIREFVTQHELGHRFYTNELYCDLYACRKLFERGYNPEQVIQGRQHLSGRNHALTEKLHEILSK